MLEPGPELVALGRGGRAERGLHAGASAAAYCHMGAPTPSQRACWPSYNDRALPALPSVQPTTGPHGIFGQLVVPPDR